MVPLLKYAPPTVLSSSLVLVHNFMNFLRYTARLGDFHALSQSLLHSTEDWFVVGTIWIPLLGPDERLPLGVQGLLGVLFFPTVSQ